MKIPTFFATSQSDVPTMQIFSSLFIILPSERVGTSLCDVANRMSAEIRLSRPRRDSRVYAEVILAGSDYISLTLCDL